jgi:polygalacturonase
VQKYGAKPDGKTASTKAIQEALDAAYKAGGGTVVVPKGVFVTGTIFIKDNTTLHLEAGATLKGSGDIKDYTALSWGGDGNIDRQPYHLVVGKDAKRIAITGLGTIDGNGPAFFEPNDGKKPRWTLAKKSKVSPMVELWNCQDVRLRDVLLTSPAGWTCHIFDCDRVVVDGVRIDSDLFTPNSDGIDITGGRDILINNCYISTCDDAICLKTSPDSRTTERVTVTNCIIRTMCVALKLGNESYKDMRQVTFSNCVVYGSSRAIGIYSQDGGVLEDITITNIVSDSKGPFILNRPIHISLLQMGKTRGAVRNVLISNFVANTDGRIMMTSEDGSKLENITLRDVQLTYPFIENPDLYVEGAKSKQFSPRSLEARKAKAAIVADNIDNLVVDNVNIRWVHPDSATHKDYQFPERIEHGGMRVFKPDYSKSHQTELGVFWGRNVKGGYLDMPTAIPSQASVTPVQLINSNITLRK